MAEVNLTQREADVLIAIEKHRFTVDRTDFPMDGQGVPAKPSSQFLLPSPPESLAARFGHAAQPLFTRVGAAVR